MGLCQISKEHISVVMSLKIPIFFVVTKIDLAPEDIFLQTMDEIRDLMHKYRQLYPGGGQVIWNKTQYKIDEFIEIYKDREVNRYPIFCISNKTGKCVDLLRYFISQLPPRSGMSRVDATASTTSDMSQSVTELIKPEQRTAIFRMNDVYMVNGVGMVLSGFMYQGSIKKGAMLHLGPIFGGMWLRVTVRSIHGNFRNEIDQLPEHQSGCLAIRNLDARKMPFTRDDLRKGVIVCDRKLKLTWKFRALILVVQGHSTTIKNGYQPIINCKTVVQNAKVSEIEKEVVRSGDKCRADFTFMFRPEYLDVGDVFNFREGQLRGMGKVLEILE
jgi:GTPase